MTEELTAFGIFMVFIITCVVSGSLLLYFDHKTTDDGREYKYDLRPEVEPTISSLMLCPSILHKRH